MRLFLLLLVPLTFCQDNTADYYWREYTGVIPRDAVAGGANINGEQVYIAQAYVKNHGLIPGQINAGVKEVWVPIDGVQKNRPTYQNSLQREQFRVGGDQLDQSAGGFAGQADGDRRARR
jgi:hypothetical protein